MPGVARIKTQKFSHESGRAFANKSKRKNKIPFKTDKALEAPTVPWLAKPFARCSWITDQSRIFPRKSSFPNTSRQVKKRIPRPTEFQISWLLLT
jgi:hypothetical protein